MVQVVGNGHSVQRPFINKALSANSDSLHSGCFTLIKLFSEILFWSHRAFLNVYTPTWLIAAPTDRWFIWLKTYWAIEVNFSKRRYVLNYLTYKNVGSRLCMCLLCLWSHASKQLDQYVKFFFCFSIRMKRGRIVYFITLINN